MARFINIATIHYQVSENVKARAGESAFRQFAEAAAVLDGTGVDLVVTCEGMEAVGQPTNDHAERASAPGPLLNEYQQFAAKNRCTVAGSVKLADGGRVYNAIAFIGPDGRMLGDYRKTYPTSGELEEGISPGNGATVVATPAGRLGGVICYDLNFNDLRDAYRPLRPDVLCFSSMFHGGHMQADWAFQCRCFLAAACKDNSSEITDPLGRGLVSTNYYGRVARTRVNLDRIVLKATPYSAFSDVYRKYGNEVVVERDMRLGAAVLYSQTDRRSAAEIAKEFGLEDIDAHFSTYMAKRALPE